ncbi:MAG: GGDEF domain-containing protein [Candidatus Gracilibacteria bacterium]
MSSSLRNINPHFIENIDFKDAKLGKDLAFLEGINEETSFIVKTILEYSERFGINLETTKISHIIKYILKGLLDSENDTDFLLAKNFISDRKITKRDKTIECSKQKIVELEKTSTTDCLTKLVNRAGLDYEMKKQIELKNRNDTNFSILLIDVDDFKQVNDKYGHLVGDKALIKLAELLKENFRQTDIIGRRGGEEFMIILPGIEIIDAANKATEIREIIETNLSLNIDEILGNITISIGVTQVEVTDSNSEKLMKKADTALYRCKHIGKNGMLIQLDHPEKICADTYNTCKQSEQFLKIPTILSPIREL